MYPLSLKSGLSLSSVADLLCAGPHSEEVGAGAGPRTSGMALGGPLDLYAIDEDGTPRYSAEYRRRLAALRTLSGRAAAPLRAPMRGTTP